MKSFAVCIIYLCCVLLSNGKETNIESRHLDQIPDNQIGRPSFHLRPPQIWLNDPNGPMYYKGVYHAFYQYNPYGSIFNKTLVWGHSVSHDLVNWIHLKNALIPNKPFDINSCFSGSTTILPGNKPVVLYTGVDSKNQQVQNLAKPKNLSDPFLIEWVKYSGIEWVKYPALKHNLLSVGQLVLKRYDIHFIDNSCIIKHPNGELLGDTIQVNWKTEYQNGSYHDLDKKNS